MTKLEMNSVICATCKMPAAVNADHQCEFCSRIPAAAAVEVQFTRLRWIIISILIVAFVVTLERLILGPAN